MAATPPGPLALPGDVLDYYLSLGYYRMQQHLFTCRFLPHEGQWYAVHWLRIVLAEVTYGPKQRQLFRQNAHFTVAIRPFRFKAEYEALYATYHRSLNFDTAPTLESLLLDGIHPDTVFDTGIIEVRDGERLIAAGIFDSGTDSIAGIVNFYHPDYAKFSLGRYLLLLKTEHCRRHRKTYYYPGYLVYGYPKFDYKLFACSAATEAFDCLNSQWRPFSWEEVAARSTVLLSQRPEEEPE